jgi:hypothetical protein
MKNNHMLALIVAYFLSKYDEFAYESFGFRHKAEAHDDIGFRLGVKGKLEDTHK